MDYKEISKKTIGYLYQAHTSIRQSGLDKQLIALAELKTSQLNGCAYCCTYHAQELRELGMEQKNIDKIPGYRHSKAFDKKQELVLQWTDAVTKLSDDLENIKQEMKLYFSERELVELTSSISLMNALNRLRIIFGEEV